MRAILMLLALAGCAPALTVAPVESRPVPPVRVEMDVPPDAAYDRVVAAVVAEGYTVAEGDRASGLVKTVGIPGDVVVASGMAVAVIQPEYFIRATITPAPDGSTVLLSVTSRAHVTGSGVPQTTPEMPLQECTDIGGPDARQKCETALTRILERVRALADRLR